MSKYSTFFTISLLLSLLFSNPVFSADCTDVNGATATISSDCSGRLGVTGDGSNITIDSGVNVSGQTSNKRFAIETTDGTNTTITVNGSIGSRATSGNLERYSIYHHTGTGSITSINNNGTMGVYENGASSTGTVIWNKSTIGNINNAASGTMTSSGRNTIVNGAGGVITKIDNDGTIESDNKWTIKNITGHIGEIDNSGTIEAGANGTNISAQNAEAAIRNYGVGEITTITNSGLITANEQTIQNSGGAVIGTINNTASGTIRAKGNDQQAIRVEDNGSIIRTINNAGTIEATRNDEHADRATIRVINGGEITTITNSGTISSLGAQSLGAIWVGEDAGTTIGSITNSGDITSKGKEGTINNHGTITIINNSSNITNTSTDAESAGIRNADSGTITTITNTGTITGASGIDIRNADTGGNTGTITTLNNSQGGSDALTYSYALPTNYNVIVNSTSDFGKATFSSVSGTTNFGIHSSSTLTENTTYGSFLSGLSSSEIASGTSGSFVSGSTRYPWTLSNSSGTLWDLVVTADIDITDDTDTSVKDKVKPSVILGFNDLNTVTQVNFANMNTYDCDLFDKNNICLSLGSRYTSINTPKTETNSAVMVGGYRLSDTLRVAGFYHSNLSHKTPASFTLSDKTPMTGGLVVWNQNPNHLGYQLKLANAQQQKNATLTREVVGTSEEGKGQTVIEAESYVAELQYGYQYSDDTVLHPYFAARSAVIKQDAYTETGNSSPLSFNEIKDKSTTVLLGLKFNTDLSHNLSLKGSLGIEHDIEHSVDKLAPTGISGLSTVSLTDSFNRTRPVVSLGFDYALKPNHRLSG
ncbi:uncharacterized protein METZ01_LOCUS112451, partial [marine metagenome]